MVDSPSNSIQTHKVLGRNSPRGRVGGQKSLKNPENPEKLGPGRGGCVRQWVVPQGPCVRFRVGVRVGVRVRFTKLVYQIGFTTPF